jgi:parallel beta-helix repeat protein
MPCSCRSLLLLTIACLISGPLQGATYYVDQAAAGAADKNSGSQTAPWKTIGRAGTAKELQPGDTVLIGSGVYREWVDIKASGEPGRPITFAAAPAARVVIKGSEIVRGPWTKLANEKGAKEPYPHAFRRLWKIRLGDEFFREPNSTRLIDKSRRYVSQVFIQDDHALQMIGPDGVYKNDEVDSLMTVGRDLRDMIYQSFFFDRKEQTLYLDIGGEPGWFSIEVGVRGFALTAHHVHDVVIRGLEVRHNRQPGGQWSMISIGECQRVVVEDCKVYFADFNGLSLGRSKDCIVRRCDMSRCGCTGMAMGETQDCTVEDCTLLFNNYRQFCGGWGVAAGMKNIPGNKRTTIRRCEAAYNIEAEGIWFDTDNSDIRILDNIAHDNANCGIFFEINPGGGVIAGNLVYGNHGRGIYVSGSQNVWVVHNTVAENDSGIVGMTRGAGEPAKNTRVLNNLMINNYITSDNITRGSDVTLEMAADAAGRASMGSYSDYNLYAANSWVPQMRHDWNNGNTLAEWQQRFGQDRHSRQMPVSYDRFGTAFKLLQRDGLDMAGPLPAEVLKVWRPANPKRVGSTIMAWQR